MAEAAAPVPLRWVVRDGEGRRADGVRWAEAAAELARAEGLPVRLTVLPPGAAVEDWSGYDVNVALGEDPRQTQGWWRAAVAGVPSLLASVPGSGDAVREALLLGAAAVVADPDEPSAVLAALRNLAEVDAQDRATARDVLALRLAGEVVDTAPRVLVVALTPQALRVALRACALVADVDGLCHLVVHRGALGRNWREPVHAASVTYVDDAATSSGPAHAERLLLLTGPDSVERLLRRVLRLLRSVGPSARARQLDALDTAASTVVARWRRLGSQAHTAAWEPVSLRVRPWLIARSAAVSLRSGVGSPDLASLDVVATTEAESHALVWRLLRDHPQAVQRRLVTHEVLAEVVRRRAAEAVAAAAGRGPGGAES